MKMLSCAALVIVLCSTHAFCQDAIRYAIHWPSVTGADVSSVLVYRSMTDEDNNFVPIGSTASSETTYADADASLEYDITYWYRLRSQNATGTVGRFSTAVVSALSLSDDASESLKSQCRIDSVVTVDSVTCRVYWSTAVPSTGRLRYWRAGQTSAIESGTASSLATQHDMIIGNLEEDAIYFVRAITHDATGMALTISARQSFTTSPPSANFVIVTSADSVYVPEGSTRQLGVKLSAEPSGAVELTLERSGGDGDVSIQSGSVLTFSTSNWDTYQNVTFAAAADQDVEDGVATIIVYVSSGSTAPLKSVRAIEADDDELTFVLDRDTVVVPESATAQFRVRLAYRPSASVSVIVSRSSGDDDITVQSGGSLAFTTTNWSVEQTVTLAASIDQDTDDGIASILVHAGSGPSVPDAMLIAREDDGGVIFFVFDRDTVVVPEAGTAQFRVRLSSAPTADVRAAVSRSSGDGSITVQSGGSLVFTTASWSVEQAVTLAAAADYDTEDGIAAMLVHATSGPPVPDAVIPAREDDDDPSGDEEDQTGASGSVFAYPMPYLPDRGAMTVANLPLEGSLYIYDLAGRRIWDTSWSGRTDMPWNGVNGQASVVASGRYFLVVKDGAGSVIAKLAILIVR